MAGLGDDGQGEGENWRSKHWRRRCREDGGCGEGCEEGLRTEGGESVCVDAVRGSSFRVVCSCLLTMLSLLRCAA